MAKSSNANLSTQFDRIKTLTIIALVSDDDLMEQLVLKGGNAIRLIQPQAVRQSLDLDFSIDNDFAMPLDQLRTRIEGLLTAAFQPKGWQVMDVQLEKAPPNVKNDVLGDFWGGYQLHFKAIEKEKFDKLDGRPDKQRIQAAVLGPLDRRTFTVDISKHEYCTGKIAKEVDGYRVYVYSAPMIVCEKIRAICQQMAAYRETVHSSSRSPRARDFFDIHHLVTTAGVKMDSPEIADLLTKMFAAKKVPLSLIGAIDGERDFHRENFEAVRDTVDSSVTLEAFDFYVDFLVDQLKPLQPLWEVNPPPV